MADESWDDDDFGTFESADASSPTKEVAVTSLDASVKIADTTTPAWLLDAQQKKDNKESILVTDLPSEETTNIETQEAAYIENLKIQSSETSISESNNQNGAISAEGWQAFASMTEDASKINSSVFSQQNSSVSQSGDNSCADVNEKRSVELKDSEVQVNNVSENEEILNLKGLLDNATTLKLHTEARLEELQNELKQVLTDSKSARELKEQEHQAEIKTLKENQQNEITLLKEESQQTMLMLTEKYASLAHQASIESKNETEKNIEDVVERCLDIMQIQGSVLSEKLEQKSTAQNETIDNLVESCRNELKDFVKSECDTVVSKCEEIKNETRNFLKAEIAKELEQQRQIDENCKREAMEELSKSLKRRLEETLIQEREKASEAIKAAVEEARRNAKMALEGENKKSKNTRERHALALQMLLSSSQEHLRHLTDTFSDQHDEAD